LTSLRQLGRVPPITNWHMPDKCRHVPRNAYKEDVQEWADMTGEMTNHVQEELRALVENLESEYNLVLKI
jgi:hypothetical protein